MLILPLAVAGALDVASQQLQVAFDPAAHEVRVASALAVEGAVPLRLRLTEDAALESIEFLPSGTPLALPDRAGDFLEIDVPAGTAQVVLRYVARLEEDVASGEREGQIHNFSVNAHVGDDGIFLAEESNWHPRPVDGAGRTLLIPCSLEIEPLDGWRLVASGDPEEGAAPDAPCWSWAMTRPTNGMAIAGNRHVAHHVVHETPYGPVEIVMQVPEEHAELAPLFVEATRAYLDIYTPLLGPFPYRRFTIAENFFSSGFAYPGFTLLGPQVVAMGSRSLFPGYIDHELIHNWWGNGVYVDDAGGNWCEALATFCANYFRRIADDGPEAGRAYRRGVLMKLSTDPAGLDDGPLGAFGSADPSAGGPGRFVGYDKGAIVFSMIGDVLGSDLTGGAQDPVWTALRTFAEHHSGRRAGWDDLQAAFEAQMPDRPAGWLNDFFAYWVNEHHVPRTPETGGTDAIEEFSRSFERAGQVIQVAKSDDGAWYEIDPGFRLYRAIPPTQLVPTIAGTQGPGGLAIDAVQRPEVPSLTARLEANPDGENLMLIGAEAIGRHADLIARSSDPCRIGDGWFSVGGERYDGPNEALLHTMHHPDHPGRFITVFHSNGEAGWSRLRLVTFYSRDSTIAWNDGQVIERRVFEPDRRIAAE